MELPKKCSCGKPISVEDWKNYISLVDDGYPPVEALETIGFFSNCHKNIFLHTAYKGNWSQFRELKDWKQ